MGYMPCPKCGHPWRKVGSFDRNAPEDDHQERLHQCLECGDVERWDLTLEPTGD